MATVLIQKQDNKKEEVLVYKQAYGDGYELVCARAVTEGNSANKLQFTLYSNITRGEEGCRSEERSKLYELEVSFFVGEKRISGGAEDTVSAQFSPYESVWLNKREKGRTIYTRAYGDSARNLDFLSKGPEHLTEIFSKVADQVIIKLSEEIQEKNFLSMEDGLYKLQLIPRLVLLKGDVLRLPPYQSSIQLRSE
jgi:hypothetical protein